MRRFVCTSLAFAAPLLAGLLALPGCGSEEKKDIPPEVRAPEECVSDQTDEHDLLFQSDEELVSAFRLAAAKLPEGSLNAE